MATTTFTAARDAISMFKEVHDALLACGMVQTNDSGQLDLTTSPTGNTTSGFVYGYTVYSWNDSYQSTYPMFIRMNWINLINQGSYKSFQPIIGEGTDGAGNITGKTITHSSSWTTTPATGSSGYVSLVDGCLTIAHAVGPSNLANFLSVDRLRNIDGSKVNGFHSTLTRFNLNQELFVSPLQSSVVTISTQRQVFFPYHNWANQSLTAVGSDIPFVPKTMLDPAGRTVLGAIAVPSVEVPADYTFTVSRFGVNRTYMSLGSRWTFAPIGGTGAPAGSLCFALLWE